jgi:hypothetical protein
MMMHMHMPVAGLLLLAAQASKAAAIEETFLFIGLRLRRSCNLVSAFGEAPGEGVSQLEAAGAQVGYSETNGTEANAANIRRVRIIASCTIWPRAKMATIAIAGGFPARDRAVYDGAA